MPRAADMSEKSKSSEQQGYDVIACAPGELSSQELARCVAIIREGEAVDPRYAAVELPRARALAVACKGTEIVGVGAIKRLRPDYAARKGRESGHAFDKNMPELGYVAVDPQHRGHLLSHRLVSALLANHRGPLFATTDNAAMKRTLAKAGFKKKGHDWTGGRGQLSLWIRA